MEFYLKLKFLLCILPGFLFTSFQSEKTSKMEEENLTIHSNKQTEADVKKNNILELIRLTTVQSELLDFMVPNLVDHSITSLGKDAKREEIIPILKKRIASDTFLEPFIASYDEHFSSDEIKNLVDFFNSKVSKKFNSIGPKICAPIIASFSQAAVDILTAFPDSAEKSTAESNIINITKGNYQKEIVESEKPLILDAYSIYCGPCKTVEPIFNDLSQMFKGKIRFAKLNVDEELDISKELEVNAMPTFLFIKDGKIADRHIGIINKNDLEKKIEKNLF